MQKFLTVFQNKFFLLPIVQRTANMLHQKFETNIPKNATALPRSQSLHSCICERFIYSHDWSANAIMQYRKIGGSIMGIHKSLTNT
jgi:hypothetical protein